MTPNRLLAFPAVVVIAAMSAATVQATVYVPASLRELATEARAVVHGQVVALESRWVEGRRGIETLVTLRVEAYAKGDMGESVTLRVPGGQMGPYRSLMLGAPTFREGEEVIVFLGSSGPSVPHLLGLGQGVYRVRADRTSGAKVVTPEIVRAHGVPAQGTRVVRGDTLRRPAPLQAFLDEVRALAGTAR